MKRKLLIFVLLILLSSTVITALEVTATVNNKKIGLNDIAYLTIEINGEFNKKPSSPNLPSIQGFRTGTPSQSESTSISVINNKVTQTSILQYTYPLYPKKKGKFIIPPVSVNVDRRNYTTKAISISVVEGTTQNYQGSQRSRRSTGRRNANTNSTNLKDNLFIETVVSNANPFQGEVFRVDYILYTRYDIGDLDFNERPVFTNMWQDKIFQANKLAFSRRERNGLLFNSMPIESYYLIADESGKVKIPPLTMQIGVVVQSNSFFDYGRTKDYLISSNEKTINVKAIPEYNGEYQLSEAVGRLKISDEMHDKSLKVGDSFTYTIKLSGSGNLKTLQLPKFEDTPYLRFMEPEVKSDINSDGGSPKGSITVKYLVICKKEGEIEFPQMNFAYFDTKSRSFKNLSTGKYTLNIAPSENNFIYTGGNSQTRVVQEGFDIGYIITDISTRSFKKATSSFLFWMLILIYAASVPGTMYFVKEQKKLSGDAGYSRNRQASKILKKYLKQAQDEAKSGKNEFYTYAQTGLSNYLADKLHIPRGSTTDDIISKFRDKTGSIDQAAKLQQFFKKCNEARFMPGGISSADTSRDFEMLNTLIGNITRILR